MSIVQMTQFHSFWLMFEECLQVLEWTHRYGYRRVSPVIAMLTSGLESATG